MTHKVEPKYQAPPLANVVVDDSFWAPRQLTNRRRTLPYIYRQCKETGRIDAFDPNWTPGEGQRRHIYYDSDVAKWVEALNCALAAGPDPELQSYLDEIVSLIVGAQQPDGYINTFHTFVEPQNRWTNLRHNHELYCAGHLMEAAVTHFQTTGSRVLLDALMRYADYIATVFGVESGKKRGYCGHPEIELALVRLYRATGEERYLALSKYFVEQRGQLPNYFHEEDIARGEDPGEFDPSTEEYRQAHCPVRQQTEVVGHAVCAMYLYCAVTDLACEYHDDELISVCERLWDHLTTKRMYITGGIGSSSHNEGFTADYGLPNDTAYAETCAAVALVFWSQRMLQANCDNKYGDVMERALYNGVLSGISLDGEKFFYENPLTAKSDRRRQDWFWCSCCPPNIARLIASLGGYVYSYSPTEIAAHLYVQGSARFTLNGSSVTLRQQTDYPWDGKVTLTVETDQPTSFTLRLRIPGWSRDASVLLNGNAIDIAANCDKGYLVLQQTWNNSDRVELDFPMPVERVSAHPNIRDDIGRVALQRGPIIYCVEEVDTPGDPDRIVLPPNAEFTAHYDKNLLGGVVTLTGEATIIDDSDWGEDLYRKASPALKPQHIVAIPYYAWANRAPGRMAVWLRT